MFGFREMKIPARLDTGSLKQMTRTFYKESEVLRRSSIFWGTD
jgi:hypothetical protein